MTNLPQPAQRASHASQVYDELLRRLRSGAIGPDDKIVDTALAAELNISRMPAREALLRLVSEGYLVGTSRGFTLPKLSARDVAEIFEIRRLLEPRAAASATIHLTDADLRGLRLAYEHGRRAEQQSNQDGLIRANMEFRRIWLEAVPNRRMAATISRFFDHVNAIRSATLHDPVARALSVRLLEQILDGFERRDALSVHDQMTEFVEQARSRFVALNEEREKQERARMA